MDPELFESEEAAAPVAEPFWAWIWYALGWEYSLLLGAAIAVSAGLTWRLVRRGHGPAVGTALLLAIPLPLWVGAIGGLHGTMAMLNALSCDAKPSHIWAGVALALVAPLVGLIGMAPAYLTALFVLHVRATSWPNSG